MSHYVAMIVQPDGVARYLVRGRLTDCQRIATHYPHPSNARQAIKSYVRRHTFHDVFTGVIDTNDPERGIL